MLMEYNLFWAWSVPSGMDKLLCNKLGLQHVRGADWQERESTKKAHERGKIPRFMGFGVEVSTFKTY
jgi:hypothetical protein